MHVYGISFLDEEYPMGNEPQQAAFYKSVGFIDSKYGEEKILAKVL